MRVLRYNDPEFAARIDALCPEFNVDPEVEATVREIISAVRHGGDEALGQLTVRFGGAALGAAQLRVSPEELQKAGEVIAPCTKEAIALAHRNVQEFAQRSLRQSWSSTNAQGVEVGEHFDGFARVGIYVPGGTAPLVSTAIMTVTLAKTAGVQEIVVTTPADAHGVINPALLHALEFAGATEIFKVGGAQAIAALAYGTATIGPVLKVFGPGNAYVVEAKRQVFGRVAVDLLPGPSEIFVIADETATAAWIAADLLAQAEHGRGSRIVFATTCEPLLQEIERELLAQTAALSRQTHLASVLDENATLLLVETLEAAVDIANRFAPEHLSIVTAKDEQIAAKVRSCGAIFLGAMSPVVGGDFVAGPSHELPTGGAGKSFSGLTVDQFQRRISIVRFDEASLRKSLPAIQTFSDLEGLDAHGRSAAIRLE